jgi:hypothetical protein
VAGTSHSRSATTQYQDAGHLAVHTGTDDETVRVATTTGDVTVTDDGVRLGAVGASVTFAGADPAANTTAEIVVVAHPRPDGNGAPTTIVHEDVHL